MEWIKKQLTKPRTYIIFFVASLVIPFVINELYKWGQTSDFAYLTMWKAEDVLSFFGSYLSFFGTIILGAVAVFQTDKANEKTDDANTIATDALKQATLSNQLAQEALTQTERANELSAQMQKLEQARFISMVSIVGFDFNRRDIGEEYFYSKKIPNTIKFDMVDQNFKTFRECYHIDVMFENQSEYPIVELFVSGKGYNRGAKLLHGIKSATNPFYIPPKGKQAARFVIPAEEFQKYPTDGLLLKLSFTNVFDYTTQANLQIDEIGQWFTRSTATEYSYQLQKIANVKPQSSVEATAIENTCITDGNAVQLL